ncbi:MAG: crossover junction endodeoxyribonuclease RuvC [Holosporales bacterium]|jgi:crossover junction endodeoxyribonuclease RuvC|nr:crossover junction endodeoxyribonuclease RuvC [Holosporales bacterium]
MLVVRDWKSVNIIGIDPGLVKTGWGVISQNNNVIKYVDCGVIKTNSKCTLEQRLIKIFDTVHEIIERFQPASVAMEEVFVNMNPKTSEKLIMARTTAFVAIAKSGLLVHEYRPNAVKKNITGAGHASKELVYTMVKKILGITIKTVETRSLDAMDALAVALCQAFSQVGGGNY